MLLNTEEKNTASQRTDAAADPIVTEFEAAKGENGAAERPPPLGHTGTRVQFLGVWRPRPAYTPGGADAGAGCPSGAQEPRAGARPGLASPPTRAEAALCPRASGVFSKCRAAGCGRGSGKKVNKGHRTPASAPPTPPPADSGVHAAAAPRKPTPTGRPGRAPAGCRD